jgi:predicted nucleotidyltransferase
MEREEVMELIRRHLDELRRFGVRSISVFGSVARDEAGPDSDVDVLVDFGPEPTFDGYMGVKFYLEDLLGTRVDVVTPGSFIPGVEPLVMKEAILVA